MSVILCNSSFFVYWHSDVDGSCSNVNKTKHAELSGA
jgi:hypothetical protein